MAQKNIVEFYTNSGEVANEALKSVISQCVEGAKICDLCALGDKMINELCSSEKFASSAKATRRGVSFPTNIGVNEISGHYAPTAKDDCAPALKNGDVVKISLGAHFEGYPATAGHTLIVGSIGDATSGTATSGTVTSGTVTSGTVTSGTATSGSTIVDDRRADVILAAWKAAEAALGELKVGNNNYQVTEAIQKAMEKYNCTSVMHTFSHEHKQDVIDGQNVIYPRTSDTGDKFDFLENSVFGMDILASTGDGKPKAATLKCNIYKREVNVVYSNRSPLTRKFLDIVAQNAGAMPFHVRIIQDERAALMGISECTRNRVLFPYSVVSEKQGEFTAGFQFTVLITEEGPKKLSGLPLNIEMIKSKFD